MVIDRGGLRYPVEVIDLFSKNLQKFRAELQLSRAAFAQFKNQGKQGVQARRAEQSAAESDFQATRKRRIRRVKQLKKQKRVEAQIARARTKSEVEELRRLDDAFRKRKEVERLRSTMHKTEQQAAAKTARARQKTARSAERLAQAEQRVAARRIQAGIQQQQQVESLRARVTRAQRRDEQIKNRALASSERARQKANAASRKAADRAVTGQGRLHKSIKVTDSSAQKLLFTFRRLVGVLALFTVARQVAAGFGALVRSGFEFNQTVERSRLGIAGIIVAVSEVADAQGRVVKGAEAFLVAQGLAREQQQLLRQDALSTVATFQELLDVFQIALGPGLAIGFDLEQVRKFSVLISQAASNIGLPQRQLSEEIRAILTGNIRATTTRLAQVLNLTNQEIREMKALGPDVFFTEMQKRLAGFALGAKAVALTMGGLFVRLKDVTELVAGAAAKGSFETLRSILQEMFNALTIIEHTSIGRLLQPAPEAQAAFDAIFNAIDNILKKAAEVGSSIGLDGLTNSAQLFANVLETVGVLLVDILGGAVRGFATLQKMLQPVLAGFRTLASILPAGVANELLVTLIQIATVLFSLKIGFLIFGGLAGKVLRLFTGFPMQLGLTLLKLNTIVVVMGDFVKKSKLVAFFMGVIRSRVLLIGGSFLVVLTGIGLIAAALLDIDVQLSDLPGLFGIAFEQVFTQIIGFAELTFKTIEVKAKKAFNNIIAGTKVAAGVLSGQISFFTPDPDASPEEQAAAIAKEYAKVPGLVEDLKRLNEENVALELELTEEKRIQERISKDADKTAADRLDKLRDEIEARKKSAAEQKKLLDAESRGLFPSGTTSPTPQRATPGEIVTLENARQKLLIRRAELNARAEIAALDRDLRGPERALRIEEIKLEKLQEQLIATKNVNTEELRRLQDSIKFATGDKRVAIGLQINNIRESQLQLEDLINLKIQEQAESLRKAQLVAEGSLGAGLGEGFLTFAEQFGSSFLAGLEIARNGTQQLADFISTVISDAFDPNKDTSIKERFGQFLQSIAKMVMQTMARLLIARAILGFPASTTPNPGQPFSFSFGGRQGGRIPGRRSQASLAHYTHGQGMAVGGRPVPPKGISRQDNVPIWAQEGEYMMRLSAVRKYGLDRMEAINQGIIDPSALDAMAGSRRLSRNTRRTVGYQSGGQIAQQTAAEAQAPIPAAAGVGLGAALLIANETTAERLLAGGQKAVLDFIDEHGADIEGRLSRFRS